MSRRSLTGATSIPFTFVSQEACCLNWLPIRPVSPLTSPWKSSVKHSSYLLGLSQTETALNRSSHRFNYANLQRYRMTLSADDPHRNQPVLQRGRPLDSARAAVILVHGRGASAADILGLADEFDSPELAYLAPEAAGHTWYPCSFLAPTEQNQPWLNSALSLLGRIVERAIEAGIQRNKIVIAGFSQGACLSTEFVARNAARYGGLVRVTGGVFWPPGTRFDYPGSLSGTLAFLGSGGSPPSSPLGAGEGRGV